MPRRAPLSQGGDGSADNGHKALCPSSRPVVNAAITLREKLLQRLGWEQVAV